MKDGEKINNLLAEIRKRRLSPEDSYEITAILESNGWTDQKARDEFGVENVFALASVLWQLTGEGVKARLIGEEKKISVPAYLLMVTRSFLKGTLFALPMALSVVSMLTLRFSLWSYEYLTVEIATSIAIGTIMSFMAVGGFTQAIARRGFLYINQGYYNMARRITFYFVRIGYLFCLVISLAFLIFNFFFSIFPYRMTIMIVGYFFILSAIWLSVTIMYILDKEMAFTGLLVAGIGLVYVFFRLMHLNIILSQIISLISVAVAGIALAARFFINAERKEEKGISPSLPRSSITIYTILPYFAYGFLYFTFLYIDRIVAWSTSTSYMPYLIWFRGQYELGLDLALLALILPMGFIEVVVSEMMVNMEANQKKYLGHQLRNMGRYYLTIYYTRAAAVAVFSIISSALVYFVIDQVSNTYTLPIRADLMSNRTTVFVFISALVGYAILSVALLNSLILFSLSQPEMVDKAILFALLVSLLVGFPLSRWIDYSFAVFGMVAGSVVFLILSFRRVIKVLSKLDYYLYQSS